MQLEIELAELRTFLSDYDLDDIYNVDETGLFWKLLPDHSPQSSYLVESFISSEFQSHCVATLLARISLTLGV